MPSRPIWDRWNEKKDSLEEAKEREEELNAEYGNRISVWRRGRLLHISKQRDEVPTCPSCRVPLVEDLEDSSELECPQCGYGFRVSDDLEAKE